MITYLDNAATTFPKPESVYDEVNRCICRYCGNPGRSSHSLSLASSRKIFECREELADFFGVSELERVAFTMNTTYALNTVIKGLLHRGDHVIVSDIEHNAVVRPVHKLAQEGIIEYDVFSSMINHPRQSPTLICAKIASLLRPNTRMVICSHASNICSATLPIKEIGEFCRKRGILFVVDGAQSAGHYPIDVDNMNISALCVPSHKGLYGIQGAGAVILGREIIMETLVEGGNGVNSLEATMPDIAPERYEAGTLPTPAIAGLCEGVKAIRAIGINTVSEKEAELFKYARECLCNIKGASVYAPSYIGSNLLFNMESLSSEATANALNGYGVCVRGGFHCAPLAHKTLNTEDSGAVRISFGIFNRTRDIDNLALALQRISAE